jgi:5'-nucleotidase
VQLRRTMALIATAAVLAAACSGDDSGAGSDAQTAASTTITVPESRRIVVTNDDGVMAPGIDALVDTLSSLDDTEVTVAAPLEEQSGAADKTSPDTPTVEDSTTLGGYPAIAVDGFPADAVEFVLAGGVDPAPDLVVSGINSAMNVGKSRHLSGTVGAAATAARGGVAALASSHTEGDPADYSTPAGFTATWVEENRVALLAGDLAGTLHSLNVPSCATGQVRGAVEVPPDDSDTELLTMADCEPTDADPTTDVEAVNIGFASLSELDPDMTGEQFFPR